MRTSDISAQVATTVLTTFLSAVIGAALDRLMPGIGPGGIALCVLAGAASGFIGYSVGYGRGESAHGFPRPTRRAMKGFSRQQARAAQVAHDAGGMSPIGDFESAVLQSIQSHEGVFVASYYQLYGMSGPIQEFSLTSQWRRFLDRPRNMRLLRERASGGH